MKLQFDEHVRVLAVLDRKRNRVGDLHDYYSERDIENIRVRDLWGESSPGDPFAIVQRAGKTGVTAIYLPDARPADDWLECRTYPDLDTAIAMTLSKWDLLCET